ncbi:gustatory and odorant receptor 21a-like [Periplaneta americana]|uniref:gustatory and odorant receptor 21a-like n=1 Tax=Periplaneta americana TaxID=6978 RepID=UPI0037E8C323
MPLKEGSKNVKVMAVLVPVLSIVAIIADWSMMPEFKVWEICGYSYTTTLVHLHVVLWYCTCCSVAACGRHLVHLLYQGTQNGRHVSNYCSLWQDLSRLSRKIGESFCYIYGLIIIIWFSTMTLSLYGGLTGILDHGCGLREFGLIVNATFCTFILFLICDAGEKLSDELGPKFLENLRSLNVVVNRDVKQELDVFRYDVAMTAPVINLGGYVSLNRNLLLNLMATMVSQMIILLQFRIGAKPDNVPQTVVFNETCKLICKEQ